jgi:hypothetical protein
MDFHLNWPGIFIAAFIAIALMKTVQRIEWWYYSRHRKPDTPVHSSVAEVGLVQNSAVTAACEKCHLPTKTYYTYADGAVWCPTCREFENDND